MVKAETQLEKLFLCNVYLASFFFFYDLNCSCFSVLLLPIFDRNYEGKIVLAYVKNKDFMCIESNKINEEVEGLS